MKRPSFQFYPDNWRNNANLRRCSWAARGAWLEIMCLMHDSDRYGVLEWSAKEIAQAIGCPMSLLKELIDKGVMKGVEKGECDPFIYMPRSGRKNGNPITLIEVQHGPIWFSSRMLKDEYLRTIRGDSTRFGAAPSGSPMGPIGEPKGAAPMGVKSDGSPSPSPSPSPNTVVKAMMDSKGGGRDKSDDSGAAAPPIPSKRGSRLPEDWVLPKAWGDWALAEFSAWTEETVRLEASKFSDYWQSKSGTGAAKLDWLKTWRNWCRDARPPRSAAHQTVVGKSFAERDREAGMQRWEQMTGRQHPDRNDNRTIDVAPLMPALEGAR